MSRQEDINELFDEVREILSFLYRSYEEAKKDRSIKKIDRVKVKSALEHLRSILDYSSMDVYFFVYKQQPPKQVCFPYGKDEPDFRNSLISKKFALLEQKNPEIYNIFSSIQPHSCASEWLIYLCNYNNENKHKKLSSQVKKAKDRVTVGNVAQVSGNGKIIFQNCIVNGLQIGKDSSTPVVISDSMTDDEIIAQFNTDNPYLPITRVAEDIQFYIDGSENDALTFIQEVTERISKFIHDLYSEINSQTDQSLDN
jgi:hypothetical protein